jgi:hypothetical protein
VVISRSEEGPGESLQKTSALHDRQSKIRETQSSDGLGTEIEDVPQDIVTEYPQMEADGLLERQVVVEVDSGSNEAREASCKSPLRPAQTKREPTIPTDDHSPSLTTAKLPSS